MAFDPLAYAVEAGQADGYNVFEIDPAEVYPAVIAHIVEVVSGAEEPTELVDVNPTFGVDPYLAARSYTSKAKALPASAFDLALVDRDDVSDADVELRAAALELARLWFTRALKNLKAPVFIRIKNRPAFRL